MQGLSGFKTLNVRFENSAPRMEGTAPSRGGIHLAFVLPNRNTTNRPETGFYFGHRFLKQEDTIAETVAHWAKRWWPGGTMDPSWVLLLDFMVADGEAIRDEWRPWIENAARGTSVDDIAEGVQRVWNARRIMNQQPREVPLLFERVDTLHKAATVAAPRPRPSVQGDRFAATEAKKRTQK